MTPDFMDKYLEFSGVGTDQTEAPTSYHRWTCASIIGALLGRQAWFPFGHSKIFPNQYIMLMGSPGARKGTALNIGKRLLKEAGYARFTADKVSKERFLMEMRQHDDVNLMEAEDILDLVLDEPSETYVMAGEFTDFIGQNNMEFVTMLTNLWDNLPSYDNPKITSKSVKIFEPTVNIIGANTVQGFALAFPPEAIGNGFLSRLLLVYGEPTGVDIAWPEPADELIAAELITRLKDIRAKIKGEFVRGPGVEEMGREMYSWYKKNPVDDGRFVHYNTRRFTHLLKLAMIFAASELSMIITTQHLLKANTMLANTERSMHKALGEFGKAKNSDIANNIVTFLNSRSSPATQNEIYKHVATDLPRQSELAEIISGLRNAEKIEFKKIGLKEGYTTKSKPIVEWPPEFLLPDWLTLEEQL